MALSAGTQAARIWAAADVRRRWRSLVVLGLLAGLSGALAMAALSGARRADTAFERLRARTDGADAVVFPSQVKLYTGDWSELRSLPYVTAIASWNLVFGTLGDDPPGTSLIFMPDKGGWLQSADRPLVREGRMWDVNAPGELLVDELVAEDYGISVGDQVPFTAFRKGQNATGTPKGARFGLTVVGIIREPSQYLFPGAGVFVSPGTADRYGAAVERIGNSHVRLADPERDVARLRRDVNRVFTKGTPVLDLHSVERRVGTAVSVERVAQSLLGIAVAIAGIVFVGQALARSVATVDDDALVLRGLGFTRSDRTIAGVLPHLLSAAVAVPMALAGALVLSPRFPIGYARTVDPDVGVHVDLTVMVPGLVVLAFLVVGGAVAVAWRRSGRLDDDATRAPNGLTASVRRMTPLPVGLGTTMAFESGKGRRSVPVRPALLGAIAGVLGIVGTFTVEHGLDDALANPERAGVTWDATVLAGEHDYTDRVDKLAPAFVDQLSSQRDASDVAILGRSVLDVDGAGVAVFDVKPVRGSMSLVVTDGRAPASADEAAVGPATAEQSGLEIGDRVEVQGRNARTFTIVGRALFPNEVHSGFTEGLWITPEAMRVVGEATDFEAQTGMEQYGAVRWREGVDDAGALGGLERSMSDGSRTIAPAEVPPELVNLKRVRSVPSVLVLFLVVLAISTLAHVLVTSVRRRRGDFAVLRSLGFTRGMTIGVVSSQSTTVGLVGLLVGIPLGLALGRLAWTWVADEVPLVYVSPVALVAMALTIPGALLVTNLVAALPGRRAARLAPATVLRTE